MLKTMILSTALIVTTAHASSETITSVGTLDQKTEQTVWNAALEQKKGGASCEDGNCISGLNLCQKDGPMYKVVTSVRDEIKRFCRKL